MLLIRNDSEQPPYSIISDDANLKDLKELHGQFTTVCLFVLWIIYVFLVAHRGDSGRSDECWRE